MNKKDNYLPALLAGLNPSGEEPMEQARPLASILANAWGGRSGAKYAGGRLEYSELSLLPGTGSSPEAMLLDHQDFLLEQELVRQLSLHQEKALRYTSFFLTQAYGARIAPGEGTDDVSLFDRNRVQAAISVCREYPGFEQEKFLFFKGAISGIQRFIYHNIQAEQVGEAEKVSKRLRGRSFFVTILGDILAEYLVETLGLEQANVLFVGGGHFNLLLPNTPALQKELDELIEKINEDLFKQYFLQLGITCSQVEIEATDFQDFGPVFQNANDGLENAKQQRFAGLLESLVFQQVIPEVTKENDAWEDLGQAVPHARFLIEVGGNENERKDWGKTFGERPDFSLSAVGRDYFLFGSNDDQGWDGLVEKLQETTDILRASQSLFIKVIRLNDTQFLPPLADQARLESLPIGYGFRLVGRHAPRYEEYVDRERHKGSLMWFEDLAAIGGQGQATLTYAQLAALRLDVDDLGALFMYGLGEKVPLSRTLSLSREMQYFFGGYLNMLADRHQIYVVYSGGDDAFVIGSWYNILHFAKELNVSFRQLSGNNPEVGFSAGVFTCHPKYPVARLGDEAGEQEKEAKNYTPLKTEGDTGPLLTAKNAISVFDHTVSWNRYGDLMQFAEQLLYQVPEANPHKVGHIRRSLLQHLLQVIQSAFAAGESERRSRSWALQTGQEAPAPVEDHFEFYRNIGRLHALLSRRGYLGRDKGGSADASDIVERLLRDMTQFELFGDYVLPFNYVLYKTRD